MERTETIEWLKKARMTPKRNLQKLYSILDELGLSFKRTSCIKCLRDYYNMALEELGGIEDAAEESEFNIKTDETMKLPVGFEPVNAVSKVYEDLTGVHMPAGLDDEPIDDGSGSDDEGSSDDNEGSGD